MTKESNMIRFGNRKYDQKYDFYSTPPEATEILLKHHKLYGHILEPANGKGGISNVLKKYYSDVTTFDIDTTMIADQYLNFFNYNVKYFDCIITNPPFNQNQNAEFIKKALDIVTEHGQVIMLLKLLYYESAKRYVFFKENPPKYIYVHHKRLNFNGSVGICYAWFVWEKGFKEKTIIDLI